MTVLRPIDDPKASLEKKVAYLDRVTARLSRRAHKKISAMVTPYPISACVIGEDIKDEVLRYLFVAKGIITKGMIILDHKPKKGVVVNIGISNDAGGEGKQFIVTKKSTSVEPNIEVFSSDKLTISVNSLDEEDLIKEVWLGFLWVPDVSEAAVKDQLISELEKDNDLPEA